METLICNKQSYKIKGGSAIFLHYQMEESCGTRESEGNLMWL